MERSEKKVERAGKLLYPVIESGHDVKKEAPDKRDT